MNCPCNYDIPDEKLCAGQLAWRHGYEDCCDNVEPQGFPDIYSQSIANTWLNIDSGLCDWCKDFKKRYLRKKFVSNWYFDCHEGSDTQDEIDEHRKSK